MKHLKTFQKLNESTDTDFISKENMNGLHSVLSDAPDLHINLEQLMDHINSGSLVEDDNLKKLISDISELSPKIYKITKDINNYLVSNDLFDEDNF